MGSGSQPKSGIWGPQKMTATKKPAAKKPSAKGWRKLWIGGGSRHQPIEDARQPVVKQLRYLPLFSSFSFPRSRLFLLLLLLFSARVFKRLGIGIKIATNIFLGDDGSWRTYLTRSFCDMWNSGS